MIVHPALDREKALLGLAHAPDHDIERLAVAVEPGYELGESVL
jgi:hypothetical protein